MTDKEKLEAVRAEIHRLVDVCGYPREMANALFTFMDSLPNEPVSEDLEEVIRKYEQRLEKENPATEAYDFASAIRFGANWQKEQMMKGAIDGVLSSTITGSEQVVSAYVGYGELGKNGDKVKIIIFKKE